MGAECKDATAVGVEMNRLLSSSLGIVNALLALAIIAAGVRTGLRNDAMMNLGQPIVGGIIGGVLGLIAATLICGIIATLVDIRNALRVILIELLRRG
jgi:uncharacterized membrane protein YraQ (UPF0718 family)